MIESIRYADAVEEKTEYIFKNVMPIPRGTVAMLSSAGGVAKTWMGLQLAMKHTKATDEEVAVWFSEDSSGQIKNRGVKLEEELGIKVDGEKLHLITQQPPQLALREHGAFRANYDAFLEVREFCIERGVKFIIIDPLLAFYGGNENDNSEARVFMQPFLEWAKQDAVTILILHHAKKDGSGTRGASAFVDAVRTTYELEFVMTDEKEPQVNSMAKDKGLRLLCLVKDNYNVSGLLRSNGMDTAYEIQVTPEWRVVS